MAVNRFDLLSVQLSYCPFAKRYRKDIAIRFLPLEMLQIECLCQSHTMAIVQLLTME